MPTAQANADAPVASEYRVNLLLADGVARAIGHGGARTLSVKFASGSDAHEFYTRARARQQELTIPMGKGRKAVLQPAHWSAVTLETPRQILVTPEPAKIVGRKS